MKTHYGQIDLTRLGNIVRQQNELVKKVQFNDGLHQLINVEILERNEPDRYGNTASIKVACKRENEKEGINYFIANLKPSNPPQQPTNNADQPFEPLNKEGDLPF